MQKNIILIFSVQSSKIKILITLNYFLAEGFFPCCGVFTI